MSSKSTFSNSTAKSYAIALYELSKENSELEKVEDGIKSLRGLLKESKDFKEMILSPTVAKNDKKNVIFVIADKNNFSKILKNFLNLVANTKGELKAKLISSKKLSPEEQKKIQSELSKDFKSTLNIDYEYKPDLIGGLIIQVGSVMVDSSIKTKLKKLEKYMLEVSYAN